MTNAGAPHTAGLASATADAGHDLLSFDEDLARTVPDRWSDLGQELAALVNDALIEQARRHGLDVS